MITKQIGDIAEQAVTLAALQRGWEVLRPIGDRLAYDLVFDVDGDLFKIQVKAAWYYQAKDNFVVDNRRTKTNRRKMIRSNYELADFDFAILYIQALNVFYIMPCAIFTGYGSEIHLVESTKRQRKPRSADYREAWQLIEQRAATEEIP